MDRIVVRVVPAARRGIEELKAALGLRSDGELIAVALRDLRRSSRSIQWRPLFRVVPGDAESIRETLLNVDLQLRPGEDFVVPARLSEDFRDLVRTIGDVVCRLRDELSEEKAAREEEEGQEEAAHDEEVNGLEQKVTTLEQKVVTLEERIKSQEDELEAQEYELREVAPDGPDAS